MGRDELRCFFAHCRNLRERWPAEFDRAIIAIGPCERCVVHQHCSAFPALCRSALQGRLFTRESDIADMKKTDFGA